MNATPRIELQNSSTREKFLCELNPDEACMIGGDHACAIHIPHSSIQPRHARLDVQGDQLAIQSIDGAQIAVNGKSVQEREFLADGDWLTLGSAVFLVKLSGIGAVADTTPVSPKTEMPAGPGALTIGRHESCDLTIPSPLVSREHAKLFVRDGHWILEDLNSTNGTFINGKAISAPTVLKRGDEVSISSFCFAFTGSALEPLESSGRVRIEVRQLGKHVKDHSSGETRHLLKDIDLVFEPGEFIGIFGTSGSGKSTLLDALNGRRPASSGKVLYNGLDLYQSFAAFKASTGYVPQQDIVHRKITIRRALRYTARLRLPADTTEQEIKEHIERVLHQVGLADKGDLPVDTPVPLSGGQLKRVSLAVELVANPSVLFLDEVTSGLDAGTDKKMMQLFEALAADDKTVVCVTHTLENIDSCDLVVLLHRGRLVYFGPPAQARQFFGIDKLSQVYELLEQSSDEEWADRFLESNYYTTYVKDRQSESTARAEARAEATVRIKAAPGSHWSQLGTLMRRYADLVFSDRRNLAILLLQAPLIAIVIGLVFRPEDVAAARAGTHSTVGFILVLSAIWFGCLNSAREVVKELPIYLRERSVNLAIGPYMFSKLVPLAVLCAVQCLILLAIVVPLTSLPGNFFAQFGGLFLACMAATTMGLTVSAFVDTNDKAVALVPILLIPQVVFSNAIVKLDGASEIFAKASMISFWAFDLLKSTFDDTTLAAKDPTGALIVPVSGAYWSDSAMISALGLAFLITALIGLKLKDRKR